MILEPVIAENFPDLTSRGQEKLIADSRLGYVGRLYYLVAYLVYLFFLVPPEIFVELDAQSRGEHGGRQVLGVIAGHAVALPVGVMLGKITVEIFIDRYGAADRGRDKASVLVAGNPAHDAKKYLPGLQQLYPVGPGYGLAPGREYAGYAHKIILLYVGVPQSEFERMQFLFVRADPFR